MSERIRLTISVTPEVHAVFTKMAEAAGMSLGKCMGDWLEDTSEGAVFVAQKLVEARKAPKMVMREFQAMARGLVDEVDEYAEKVRKEGLGGGQHSQKAVRAPAKPPYSPTGVNTGKTGRTAK